MTYLTHRHRLIAKKKKKDCTCDSYQGDLFNKANYHSVSNGIKLMSQRCYKELVPPTGVGSKARCDWFKKLYPHQIRVCGKSHTVWQALKATKPLPKQPASFSTKVIINASHLAAWKQSPWCDRPKKPACNLFIYIHTILKDMILWSTLWFSAQNSGIYFLCISFVY